MEPLGQFLMFGDSITQGSHDQSRGFGLGAELQAAYVRRLDVINRGFSGYTSDHALEVVAKVLPNPSQAPIKFLTIWFGANDANKNLEQGQFVPADRFKQNLNQIVNHPAVKAHSPHIILLTTPPFEENVLQKFQEDWGYAGEVRKAKDAAEYAELVREVGKETDVDVVDVWTLFMEKAGWKTGEPLPGSKAMGKNEVLADLLYDGLHISPTGYRVVFDALIKLIKEKWPEYRPYKMPFVTKVAWEIELGDQMWDVKNDAL
ncbi:GDSL Lipase/Acylhydrolase family protein-like protein [Mollisia scopiformis]|uniref:GDSL Lipase/Acylhydrolase family protein-like protein n=1 Tax=Mollisia scopiformis TaxID=149040 RepID=A0A194X922_MOLSC|nr:GDSL Lipase/Acylhydrolase family protein-like protein [Mollisia scopiformis]KUJ16609.1 GDSL Lipase/Acylhydrolase family protein-like protein [Mollisia scopiformis]